MNNFDQDLYEIIISTYLSGFSISTIAEVFSISPYIVHKCLDLENINCCKKYLERRTHNFIMNKSLREIIDGILLSDGHISWKKNRATASLVIDQTSSHFGWIKFLQQKLNAFGIKSVATLMKSRKSLCEGRIINTKPYYKFRTLNYVEFVKEYKRWYPHGKKIIPKDICLTPMAIMNWFCGDGTGGDPKGVLKFCTDDFTKKDVKFLIKQLFDKFCIESYMLINHRGHPHIYIGKRDEAVKVKFLIYKILPKCFRYKLKFVRPRTKIGRGRKLTDKLKTKVKNENRSQTCRKVADKYGISPSKVWCLWNE